MGKVGRNAPCPCESGRKYKSCCGAQAASPLSGLTPSLRMKGGVRFDLETQGFIVIVHTWDNAAGHGEPTEWREPQVFATEEAAMQYYTSAIRPGLTRLLEDTSRKNATFIHQKLE